jgi:integrase
MVAFNSGLRKGALTGLRWRDVDWDAGTVTVERTKNGRGIVCPLTPETMAELKAIKLIDDKQDSLIFCGKHPNRAHDFRHSWERVLDECGIEYMPFHAMRHSTASHAAKNGASTIMLMNLLGHSSPKMSARYAHLAITDKSEFINRIF